MDAKGKVHVKFHFHELCRHCHNHCLSLNLLVLDSILKVLILDLVILTFLAKIALLLT